MTYWGERHDRAKEETEHKGEYIKWDREDAIEEKNV